eukprot:3515216-Rhodomonas_salina.1
MHCFDAPFQLFVCIDFLHDPRHQPVGTQACGWKVVGEKAGSTPLVQEVVQLAIARIFEHCKTTPGSEVPRRRSKNFNGNGLHIRGSRC